MKSLIPHQSASSGTVVHRLEPTLKMVSFFLLIISVSIVPSPADAVPVIIFGMLLICTARFSLTKTAKTLAGPMFLILVMAVFLLFSGSGDPILTIGFLKVTGSSLSFSLLIFLRSAACLILSYVFFGTTPFNEVIRSLYRLKMPEILVQILMISYQYIFVFERELSALFINASAKGFHFRLDRQTLRTVSLTGNMIGMLLIRSFERAGRVYYAMISKGYSGKAPLMTGHRKSGFSDILFLIFCLSLSVFIHLPLRHFPEFSFRSCAARVFLSISLTVMYYEQRSRRIL